MDAEAQKRAAAARALDMVRDGMRLGLGTGSTARHFVELLGERVRAGLNIEAVPTSEATRAQAAGLGIALTSLDDVVELDLTVDGADEIAPDLTLIKGGGGALLREKIVAAASARMVVIADESKWVSMLGRFPLPIEIAPFGAAATHRAVEAATAEAGCPGPAALRKGKDGQAFVTDGGHWLLDASLQRIADPPALAARLRTVPGVMQHGLFIGMAWTAILAGPDGVRVVERSLSSTKEHGRGMSDYDVDLFVIGGGSGGVRAARIAAQHGARVMVAEEYRVGGTCVIRGCVPKKLLVYASRFRAEFEDAVGYGWTLPQSTFDWPTLIANKDREIARLEAAYTATLQKARVTIVKSRAVIADPHTVQLADGKRVRAAYILIATGGTPSYGDDIPGIEHAITSNEAFHLPRLPPRVVIQGGGYIALEFAGIFAGLGAHVTVVYRGENILRGFDDEVRQHVRRDMEKRGIHVFTGSKITAIERTNSRFSAHLSGGNQLSAECVMFATGRAPNIGEMGLKEVGVEIAKNGGVAVDEFSRTSVVNVYAIGDVTNRINLTPVAIREGAAFSDTVFGGKSVAVDHTNVPTAVFSDPEVGVVGLTEAEARVQLAQTDIYKAMFKPLKATLSGRDTTVMTKLVVDGGTDRVVGCHIVGEGAAEMIQVAAIAVKMGATKADFDATMALHPTTAEELVTMRQKSASYAREAAE